MKKILITPRSLTKSGHPALEKLSEAGYQLVFSTPGNSLLKMRLSNCSRVVLDTSQG